MKTLRKYYCTLGEADDLTYIYAYDKDDAKAEFFKYCKDNELKGLRYIDVRVRLLDEN